MGLISKIDGLRKNEKKIDDRIVTEMSYPSGLLPLDYANGVRVVSYDENDRPVHKTDLIGFVGGSKITTIGLSGTGKTALAIELAATGIHMFGDKSGVQHADIEKASTMQRPIKILRLPPSILRETYAMDRDMAAEDIVDKFMSHCKVKLDNRKEYTYDTGVYNLYNERMYELYPSAMLIDSFAMFKSKEVDLMAAKKVEDVTHNMIAAQAAKFNKGVLGQMVAYGKKANVSIISVNHLLPSVNTGFLPKPSQHMYLSQDEMMPGGQATIFLANNIIKLKVMTKWNIDKPEKMEYGFKGFLIEARLLKSRTNSSNIPIELVFDGRRGGFSKLMTLFHYAYTNKIIQGSPNSMYLPGYTRTKFTRKTFEESVERDPELIEALLHACLPSLETMLSTDYGDNTNEESSSQRLDAMYMAIEEHEKDVEDYKKRGWLDF